MHVGRGGNGEGTGILVSSSSRTPLPHPLKQKGDKIVYSKYAGTEVELQSEEFVILKVRFGFQKLVEGISDRVVQVLTCMTLPWWICHKEQQCWCWSWMEVGMTNRYLWDGLCCHNIPILPPATYPTAHSPACSSPQPPIRPPVSPPQEDDVIGLINGDDIAALRPCQDRLLVEMQEAASKTAGGLLLTESSQEKPTIGRVVAVGPGRVEEDGGEPTPMGVEAGATVLYSKYSGTEFEGAGGKKYIVIRGADILATVA